QPHHIADMTAILQGRPFARSGAQARITRPGEHGLPLRGVVADHAADGLPGKALGINATLWAGPPEHPGPVLRVRHYRHASRVNTPAGAAAGGVGVVCDAHAGPNVQARAWSSAAADRHTARRTPGAAGSGGLTLTWCEGLSMELSCSPSESSPGMAGYPCACCVITTRSGCLSRCASTRRLAIASTMPASYPG